MRSLRTLRAVVRPRPNNVAVLANKHSTLAGWKRGEEGGDGDSGNSSGSAAGIQFTNMAAAAAAAAIVAAAVNDRLTVSAKEDKDDIIYIENRVRQFSAPDAIFNYFASYLFVGPKDGKKQSSGKGRRAMMMTPLEFYAAITPDCRRLNGVGAGVHVEITEEEIKQNKMDVDRSPVGESILNQIGDLGLLSYSDYCFLLSLLSTPRRYIETQFNLFDVNGNEHIGAKEFAYVSSKMAHRPGGFGSYTDEDQDEIMASSSGLLNYLFGIKRDKVVSKEHFKKLQTELLGEIIELEFMEYDKDNSGRISEADFVKFLLKYGRITTKKRSSLIKRVESKWPSKGRGISLASFKKFFYVLAGGVELERALFFLDVEGIGVDKEEFRRISSWVSGTDTSDHIVEVIFTLLDADEDGRLQCDELSPVLMDWRHARGYDKGGIRVSLGEIRI